MFVIRDRRSSQRANAASSSQIGQDLIDSEITLGWNRAFSSPCARSEFAVGLLSSRERIVPLRIKTDEPAG